jgi:hypothetical protein
VTVSRNRQINESVSEALSVPAYSSHPFHAHLDLLLLADAVRAVHRLQVHLRVPVRVVQDHDVRRRQVDAQPARARRQQEDELLRPLGTGLLWDISTLCAVVPPPGLYGVVGTGLLWDISTLCAVVPPPGLYGVVGTGLLWDISTLCAVVPPPGLYGVVGTVLLWDVSTLCAVVPPPRLCGVVGTVSKANTAAQSLG